MSEAVEAVGGEIDRIESGGIHATLLGSAAAAGQRHREMLDCGAALWQMDVDTFEREVSRCAPMSGEALAGTVAAMPGTINEP